MSGFRFRKRIKLVPGVWLNLSKRGISTSVGIKGLTVNLNGDKTRTTVSAPGTGLSYSSVERGDGGPFAGRGLAFIVLLVMAVGFAIYLVA